MKEKSLLRKHYKALRDTLLPESGELSRKICEKCSTLPEFLRAGTVLLYSAKGSEADLSSLAEAAFSLGKTVAYPRCTAKGEMSFYSVLGLGELSHGSYGIREPGENAPVLEGDLSDAVCFVPAVAFDLFGYRLGYGGGYYDRFLKDFSGVTVGIAYEACLAQVLPREEHDKKTDYIITESRVKKTIED